MKRSAPGTGPTCSASIRRTTARRMSSTRRMGETYAQAAYVFSRLGNDVNTAQALRVLVDMPESIDTANESMYPCDSTQSERISRACIQLGLEPYWGRVWILQEVACARNCIVASGDVSLDFEDLFHRMEVAMVRNAHIDNVSERNATMNRVTAYANLRASIQQGRSVWSLELIQKTSFCRATRDHDKVYGLLGLASRLDSGFDPSALEITQHKALVDVWWDIVFMILQNESHISSVKDDMEIMGSLVDELPPLRKPSALELGSGYRRALTEQICLVSEAANSNSIQTFLGIDDDSHFWWGLQDAWSSAMTHVFSRQLHVPCLQKSVGWAAYAGLRFTSWHGGVSPKRPTKWLPLGWFCAAYCPDAPSRITKKHQITSVGLPPLEPFSNLTHWHCLAAKDDKVRCDLSSVVLKVQSLGVTCLVSRSYLKSKISFYCDCCDPPARPGFKDWLKFRYNNRSSTS